MLEYALFTVVVIVILIALFRRGSKRNTTIPGPPKYNEFEGNLPDIKASGSLHEFLKGIHDTYGPITSFWLGPTFCVSVASPELFKRQANVFDRPKALYRLFEPLITPQSIQYTNGSEGRKRHAAYAKCYTHEANRGYFDLFRKYSTDMSNKLESLAKDQHIPLTEHMFAYSIRSLLSASFGDYFLNDKEVLEFKRAYDFTWNEIESQLSTGATDASRQETFEMYKNKMFDLVMAAAAHAKNNPKEEENQKKFVDVVNDLGLSDDVVKADMITFVVGAVHTTALLLTWAVYFLATHKDIQEKVYNELREVLGDEPIVFEAVPRLKYMRQVIDETLRCSILAPITSRYQDTEIELGGHKVPAGTPVVLAQGVLACDEKIWPEPEKFDPERFNDDNRKKIPSYAFSPFGFAGKRQCPGYKFSDFESTVLLAELMKKFQFDLVEGQVVKKVYGLVTKPMDEIWVTVEKRA